MPVPIYTNGLAARVSFLTKLRQLHHPVQIYNCFYDHEVLQLDLQNLEEWEAEWDYRLSSRQVQHTDSQYEQEDHI